MSVHLPSRIQGVTLSTQQLYSISAEETSSGAKIIAKLDCKTIREMEVNDPLTLPFFFYAWEILLNSHVSPLRLCGNV